MSAWSRVIAVLPPTRSIFRINGSFPGSDDNDKAHADAAAEVLQSAQVFYPRLDRRFVDSIEEIFQEITFSEKTVMFADHDLGRVVSRLVIDPKPQLVRITDK